LPVHQIDSEIFGSSDQQMTSQGEISSSPWAAQTILVSGLRRLGLKTTGLAQAQVSTIRTKLLKMGALIRVTVRKVWVSMASSYPWQDLYQQVWTNLSS
jgi:hypothetical protein